VDPISRVQGVGEVQVFGAQYAMRIWLDPNKLDVYKLTTDDVIAAVQSQNQQVAVGQLGGTPAIDGQQLNATISAQGRLETPEQFRAFVILCNADFSALKRCDICRVYLGGQPYDHITRYNGQPTTGMAPSLATGANALDSA